MVRIVLGLVACAAFCLGSAAAWAQPPGHAERSASKADKKSDKGLLEHAIDEVLGRQDGERRVRRGQNPNSNAQWLPDAKRGQARAAERRPAHAGPKHHRGDADRSPLDGLLGGDERAKSKRKRDKKLGKFREGKHEQDVPDDLVGILVEKSRPRKVKN